MRFAISNQSSLITPVQVATIAQAIIQQLKYHVAPAWDIMIPRVSILPDTSLLPVALAKRLIVISIKDSLDVPNALGDHSVDDTGFPIAEIGVKETLGNGGTILGPDGLASVVSHEIIETIGDEYIGEWDDAPDGSQWAHELCDAVQGGNYPINGVSVSNFLLPPFFDSYVQSGSAGTFDYMGQLGQPFTLGPGGYSVIKKDGVISQIFADSVSEADREKIKAKRRIKLRMHEGI